MTDAKQYQFGGKKLKLVLKRLAFTVIAAFILLFITVYAFELRPKDLDLDRLTTVFLGPVELPPPVGTDVLLSEAQARFCVNEAERLARIRAKHLTRAKRGYLRLAIDSYNLRCASYRAPESMIARLKNETRNRSTDLDDDVDDRLKAWTKLSAQRHGKPAPADPVTTGLRRLNVQSRYDVRLIQQKLRTIGVYKGRIDGRWGKSSEKALIVFKRAVGLGANADWTIAVQRRLFSFGQQAGNMR